MRVSGRWEYSGVDQECGRQWEEFAMKKLSVVVAVFSVIGGIVLFSSVGEGEEHPLRGAERRLGVEGENQHDYHRIVEDPIGLGLKFPGYLIGFEKAPRESIGAPVKPAQDGMLRHQADDVGLDGVTEKMRERHIKKRQKKLDKLANDGKSMFISHIAAYETSGIQDGGISTRFVYNIYSGLINSFDLNLRLEDCPVVWEAHYAYQNSYLALRCLENDIGEASKAAEEEKIPFTHVIVMSMGWNTPQEESIRNFNSLMGNLNLAAGQQRGNFRPLFIGITWPSKWRRRGPLSYINKANDADEIGFGFANRLLNDHLAKLKEKYDLKVVLIGHSFGARVISRAAYSGRYLEFDGKPVPPALNPDLMIAIQGAFSMNRFLKEREKGKEGAPYAHFDSVVGRTVLTWSIHDTANPTANWFTGANHVGGGSGHDRAKAYCDLFDFHKYRDCDERLETPLNSSKILYLDVSEIVRYQTYGKGGNAHSDIYTPEMGRLLWKLIQSYAPQGNPPRSSIERGRLQ